MSAIVWRPNQSTLRQTAIERFSGHYANCRATDYQQLHQWSINDPGQFWSNVWDFCKITGTKGSSPWMVTGDSLSSTQWFPDARLNFAENLMFRESDATALVFYSEQGERRIISHDLLFRQVARLARCLRQAGLTMGDRVSACVPNSIETVVAFLATASIGAIWSSCSPDFGARGILDRFGQIRPKVFLFVRNYSWKGKEIDLTEKLHQVIDGLPDLVLKIQMPFYDMSEDSSDIPDTKHWSDIQESGSDILPFEKVPFDHPLYILFSSGTTGVPKCIVHRTGGMLLQHVKEHQLHNDIAEGDKVFFYTTTGWMMWNWLVTALASKATVVLYDGSPLYPHPEVLFDHAAQEKISFFGTSARYLAALAQHGVDVTKSHDLSSLRAIGSTGSVLSDEGFDYVYQHIKPNVRLSSMSGGTDIASCFVLGNPVLPVVRGEIQSAGLAMQVAVVNNKGQTVTDAKGELICRNAFPAMPLGFWNDGDGSKYHNAYFSRFDNIWTHGDYAIQTSDGGFIIYGRSDTTLNPGGVRIGTAEIYRQVEKIPQVVESVVIAQDWKDDVRIVLFVVLGNGIVLTEELQQDIQRTILANTTPRHVPDIVLSVADIPRTRNGKITELAVRDVIHGTEVRNIESLDNPEALAFFRDRKELR